MSAFENVSIQMNQGIDKEQTINSPTSCSNPMKDQMDSKDKKPHTSSSDSGISQVFFPPNFNSDVKTASLIWSANDSVSVFTNKPKRRLIKFLVF
jgi:hypothetical protein